MSGGDVPFAEETQRLLAAVQDWAQRALPAPPSGHPGPECQWCPLCQLARVLRGEHPEIADRLTEAGTAVTGAVRALLDSAARRVPTPRPTPRPADGVERRQPPRVERIRLDGDG